MAPRVIWFTGLSGSGKSTLASQVAEKLSKRGLRVEYLDGDALRKVFPTTGFSKEERQKHVERVGYLASRLEANGVFVVASLISPYQDSRKKVRSYCKNFTEVYLSTPLEVCEARDVKGLYARARSGDLPHFTGISDPYEPPTNAEVTLDTSQVSEQDAVQCVLNHIQ